MDPVFVYVPRIRESWIDIDNMNTFIAFLIYTSQVISTVEIFQP
jgi:hypothetical protein